jgi:hypothetical protein
MVASLKDKIREKAKFFRATWNFLQLSVQECQPGIASG